MNSQPAITGLPVRPGPLAPFYRELRPAEHGLLQDHIFRLSPESRILRFGYPTSDYTVSRYCANENQPLPIICGAFVGDVLRGVIELRFGGELPEKAAEIAISVEDDWRDMGMGTALMTLAFRLARDHGLTMLEVNFVPHNTPMRRLARKFGARFSTQTGLIKGSFSLTDQGFAAVAGSRTAA
ncbi:GNAT family N-acetyltransferase [Sneathiella sp.]|jgi:RimJ/RimL family protein N-acetyltransferase|uniref:GNAT family N-acetyltransferase n=1 Tax=Sneathiella sp. TaxID=1964365 RepID=UPI0025E3CD86|nr:GNAT family N-acetyltransferase [Sneathiella sp.]